MNNLLRTLTESQVKSIYPDSDLKLLLNTVKEARRQSYDNKVSAADPFYDSLEGLLLDLKTVTIDNHDAEAFLKPVSKAEAPDYYDVISTPMDFASMLKKVKLKQYKSKREFKDDLELIWSNCLTYNAAESHPLRPCVKRLKLKADRLLKYITDRKERADPPIPSDIAATHVARPKTNGTNGRLHAHKRSPSISTVPKSTAPTSNGFSSKPIPRRDAPFPDTLALTRTPDGMALFSQLERRDLDAPESLEKLQELAAPIELPDSPPPENGMAVDGEKRKLNGSAPDTRPRKRARYSSQYPTPLAFEKNDVSELWWGAVQSDAMLANGLPHIPFASSSSLSSASASSSTTPATTTATATPAPRAKRRKKPIPIPPEGPPPKSLLSLMNNNIKTMKRLRHTHAKFAALTASTAPAEEGEEGPGYSAPAVVPGAGAGVGVGVGASVDEVDLLDDDKVDERPWSARVKGKRPARGVEMGEESAAGCVDWMTGKVLEHAGFQGSSQAALSVLAGVTSEYLLNVGRTIKFLCDKYSTTMTPEEIILHTLFESGTSKIQDLERYISDDVERYGARLLDLEKKLVTAYRESSSTEVLEDEGLFEEEDEEEAGALAIGDFADALGEDYLGLRELGIAAEFGMSSLSIPKKLLKRKKAQNQSSAAAKPTEPPPPYPPPPPFIPLTSDRVDDQIGLLKPYYRQRFEQLAAASQPPPPPAALTTLPGPSITPAAPSIPMPPPPAYGMPPYPPTNGDTKAPSPNPPAPAPAPAPPAPPLVLPDDAPPPAQVKMGPLGQILKGGPAGGTSKKKKAAAAAGASVGVGVGADGVVPKKKKTGMVGVGTGNGRKKKVEEGVAGAGAGAGAVGGQPPVTAVAMQIQYAAPPPPVAAYALPLARQIMPPTVGGQ
ncbi:hypothetical protein H0H81_011966 [Sphagnurus paluster]|uniref:Bromo domain-containing protein n=1 Tax=Sphagnurus paluster TaxID=117069 RepID=A0A9P7K3K3_9AGAR|nr:hypothetical protein H0H81_011966 [Sphagnurus paluster]